MVYVKLFLAKPIRAGQHNIIASNRITEDELKKRKAAIPGMHFSFLILYT